MSTTLVTFMVQIPRGINSVRLIGSWDNFSKPYPMAKDTSLGGGHWRGCHSFTDIICDGQSVESADCKRDGALMQGGKYWYYYQLDDDLEFSNPREPITTSCPFLPGQQVNVLEVPVQASQSAPEQRRPRSTSAQFTLDPEDKYRTPKPPALMENHDKPNSQPKERSLFKGRGRRSAISNADTSLKVKSLESVNAAIYDAQPVADDDSEYRTAPPSRARSLRRSSSRKLRRWASVVSRLPSRKSARIYMNSDPEEPVPPLPRPGSAWGSKSWEKMEVDRVRTAYSDQSDYLPRQLPSRDDYFSDGEDLMGDVGEAVKEFLSPPTRMAPPIPVEVESTTNLSAQADTEPSSPEAHITRLEPLSNPPPPHTSDAPRIPSAADIPSQTAPPPSAHAHDPEPTTTRKSSTPSSPPCPLQHSPSGASTRTSGVFSSVVDSATVYTGPHTPWRLSQPLTPTFSTFGDFTFSETRASPQNTAGGEDMYHDAMSRHDAMSHHDAMNPHDAGGLSGFRGYNHDDTTGFRGYNLPEAEHASALTLRNLETAGSKSETGEMSAFEPHHRDEIIRAWNQGAVHYKSAVQELVHDFNYLGKMIA